MFTVRCGVRPNKLRSSTLHCDAQLIAPYASIYSSTCPTVLCIMQAFVQKLAICLLEVDGDPNSPMVEHMNNWTAEATCFVSCLPCSHIHTHMCTLVHSSSSIPGHFAAHPKCRVLALLGGILAAFYLYGSLHTTTAIVLQQSFISVFEQCTHSIHCSSM